MFSIRIKCVAYRPFPRFDRPPEFRQDRPATAWVNRAPPLVGRQGRPPIPLAGPRLRGTIQRVESRPAERRPREEEEAEPRGEGRSRHSESPAEKRSRRACKCYGLEARRLHLRIAIIN